VDSDCPLGTCPDGHTYKAYSCSENHQCGTIEYVADPCIPMPKPSPECSVDSDCPIGKCDNGKTYNKYSCVEGQCSPNQFITDPCNIPQPEKITFFDRIIGWFKHLFE